MAGFSGVSIYLNRHSLSCIFIYFNCWVFNRKRAFDDQFLGWLENTNVLAKMEEPYRLERERTRQLLLE